MEFAPTSGRELCEAFCLQSEICRKTGVLRQIVHYSVTVYPISVGELGTGTVPPVGRTEGA